MSTRTETYIVCDGCGKDEDNLGEEFDPFPNDRHLCEECRENGWSYCRHCGNVHSPENHEGHGIGKYEWCEAYKQERKEGQS